MKKKRAKLTEKVLEQCVVLINHAKLSEDELIILLGHLIIRIGYSLYFNNKEEKPENVTRELAEELAFAEPHIGTSLMKLGYDITQVLESKEER